MQLRNVTNIDHWEGHSGYHGHFPAQHLIQHSHALSRDITTQWWAEYATRVYADHFHWRFSSLTLNKVPGGFFGQGLTLGVGVDLHRGGVGPVFRAKCSSLHTAKHCNHRAGQYYSLYTCFLTGSERA